MAHQERARGSFATITDLRRQIKTLRDEADARKQSEEKLEREAQEDGMKIQAQGRELVRLGRQVAASASRAQGLEAAEQRLRKHLGSAEARLAEKIRALGALELKYKQSQEHLAREKRYAAGEQETHEVEMKAIIEELEGA